MAYTTIKKPSDYFNTVTYTGDDVSPRTVTGVNFQPDFTWIKRRTDDIGANNILYDSVRGAGSTKELSSNSTASEGTILANAYGYLSAFASDGFTLTDGTSGAGNEDLLTNESGKAYASWNWLASNTTASNTDGSITSTVSANTTSGFSIVTYTGNGSAGATIGHGLGVKPSMMIVKRRDAVDSWGVWHKNLTSINYYLRLDGNTAEDSGGSTIWNSTEPTSSLITVGTSGYSNASSGTYVNYCFAEKKGFSKFGSYTGNGNNDGTFVYLGFKPAFVMVKNTVNNARNWTIIDNKRNTFNPETQWLYPNTADAELDASSYPVDFVSNGFKIRTGAGSYFNTNAENYIYMAFAEQPLVGDNPATAR